MLNKEHDSLVKQKEEEEKVGVDKDSKLEDGEGEAE